jgi:hypothetical protein
MTHKQVENIIRRATKPSKPLFNVKSLNLATARYKANQSNLFNLGLKNYVQAKRAVVRATLDKTVSKRIKAIKK